MLRGCTDMCSMLSRVQGTPLKIRNTLNPDTELSLAEGTCGIHLWVEGPRFASTEPS